MALATFAAPATPITTETLSRTVAAARLELHIAHVDKLIHAGMLPTPITAASVDTLLGRPKLRVTDGQLTVLRTGAKQEADLGKYPSDPRKYMGFHVKLTDAELDEASLRWWRCDATRVLDNELFVVTVATYPVAVYKVTGLIESATRPGEDNPRQHFAGTLLARVTAGMAVTLNNPMRGDLVAPVKQIMASRITVRSGGPIGYLDA